MGSPRQYMREYMQRRRRAVHAHCACGSKAFKMVNGNEGICERCWKWENNRVAICRRGLTGKKWEEAEPETAAVRYWKQKLEFWLPNPTPGWGSLAVLERLLRQD